jgi:hypothetical protein
VTTSPQYSHLAPRIFVLWRNALHARNLLLEFSIPDHLCSWGRIRWVFLCLRHGGKGETFLSHLRDQLGKHPCIKRTDMKQQHIGNLVTEDSRCLRPLCSHMLARSCQIGIMQTLNGRFIMLCHATRIGLVPQVITKFERDLGDFVTVLRHASRTAMFFGSYCSCKASTIP